MTYNGTASETDGQTCFA